MTPDRSTAARQGPASFGRRVGQTTAWAVAGVVLAGTFAAYFSPDMAVTLANFVWSCFGG